MLWYRVLWYRVVRLTCRRARENTIDLILIFVFTAALHGAEFVLRAIVHAGYRVFRDYPSCTMSLERQVEPAAAADGGGRTARLRTVNPRYQETVVDVLADTARAGLLVVISVAVGFN